MHLLNLIDVYHISDIVIAINGEIQGTTFQTILDAQEKGVEVTRMPILYEEMTGRVPVHHLESDWIIRSFVDGLHVSGFYELTKRLLDILGGIVGVLIFAITYPFLALAVLMDSGLPIFYSQPRLGRGGLIFNIYKYRTMRQDAEADGEARTDVGERSACDAGGQLFAKDAPGRTASVLECPARRNESGGTACGTT